MNFDEAGKQYHAMKNLLEKGDITEQQFLQMVEKMWATAPDGKRWGIDPQTGNWVEWGESKPSPSPGKAAAKSPESLLQLLVFLGKGLLTNVPRLIMTGLVLAVLTWAAHTYLIAKVNDGLMFQAGKTAVNSMVHLRETHFPGINAFWGLLAYFLSSFFMRARAQGLTHWLNNIKSLPGNIKDKVARNREQSFRLMALGATAALLFGFLYRNFMLSWVLAFGILLILTAHLASLEVLVLRVGLLDFQRLSRRKIVTGGEEDHTIFLFLVGAFAGFALAGIWRTQFFFTLLSALLLLALYIYIFTRGLPRLAAFFLLVLGGVISLESTGFAWCEGASLREAGGSWLEWWGSRNADVVRRLGLIPAGFSFAGGVLGSGLALLPAGDWTHPAAAEPPAEPPPAAPGRTRILSGNDAVRWLESRELLQNGVLTPRFWNEWHSYLGGGEGNPYGLGAVAGDWSTINRDRPIGDISIVVKETPEAPEPEPEIIPPIPPRLDPERITPGDDTGVPPDGDKVPPPDGGTRDTPPPPQDEWGPERLEREETPPLEAEKEAESPPVKDESQGPERDEYGMPVGVNPVDVFQEVMNRNLEKMRTRYWVMNPQLRDTWMARLGHGDPSLLVKAFNRIVTNNVFHVFTDWEGGQCGEFAAWGISMSKDTILETFPGAFLYEIVLERNALMNHAATHVILPNGDRYVLDYWEGMQQGGPRVYTEKDWMDKWKGELGQRAQRKETAYLWDQMKVFGDAISDPEEAADAFLSEFESPLGRTIARSYRRNPW